MMEPEAGVSSHTDPVWLIEPQSNTVSLALQVDENHSES